jgi:hypothetical protein
MGPLLHAERLSMLRCVCFSTMASARPTAQLFPGMRLDPPQSADLAALSVAEAEARLVLDWAEPLRHLTLYRAVFRPAVAGEG